MQKLTCEDLFSLEEYAQIRSEFRAQALAHKRRRQIAVGPNATLFFEDRRTVHYQIQEMLRIEHIFERQGIEEELVSYNPLIPDGFNFKATFMLEFEEPAERQHALVKMRGIERKVWVRIGDYSCIWAIADEDMERENERKTAAVHFLRFELNREESKAMLEGIPLCLGVEHTAYHHEILPVANSLHQALCADLCANEL